MTKEKNTSIRLGDELIPLIDQYAAFVGSTRSKVIREILIEGLFQKTKYVQFQRLQDYLAKREAFSMLEKCEKCDSIKDIGFFHIDGNIDNSAADNLVTLCIPCMSAFETFRLKKNIKEKFVEWFFS
jgi:predicted transcriptional regulator